MIRVTASKAFSITFTVLVITASLESFCRSKVVFTNRLFFLRILLKVSYARRILQHDQQAKIKAMSRRLAYADFDKEALAKSLARGFSNRFSLESSGISDIQKQTRSASKNQRTASKNKEPAHLRRLRRLEDRSITKEKARRERSKSRG
ncbi:hypothetical protein Tco_0804934 [Tanacetum coccineum]